MNFYFFFSDFVLPPWLLGSNHSALLSASIHPSIHPSIRPSSTALLHAARIIPPHHVCVDVRHLGGAPP